MKVRVTEKKSLDSLRRKMENKGYLSFSHEMRSLSEEWQYLEPGEIEFSDRLDMDRNDFKDFYYNDEFRHSAIYKEESFLKRLINIYKEAKHEYFIEYRKFVQSELNKFNLHKRGGEPTKKKSRINYEMIASARKIHGENPSPNKKKDYSSARNLATYLSSKSENGQTFGKSFVNNHLKDLIIGK